MTVWAHVWFSQRATWPPSAAVRQRSIALMTFIWPRLTWPALACRHAAPWSRKISATSSAGRDTALLRRRLVLPVRLGPLGLPGLLARLRQPVERALDAGDQAGGDTGVACRGVQLVVTQQCLDNPDISLVIEQVGREAVAQRVQRHALPDPGRIGGRMEQAAQLTGGHRLAAPQAGKQPAFFKRRCRIVPRWARLPPLPQQSEHLGRQHDIAVLASLRLLDANDLLRAVDMLDLEPDYLAGAQTAAIAETEQHAGLEARGDGEQAPRLILAHHQRDLLRLAQVIILGGKIQSPQRHAEQEPQPGHDAVAIADAHADLGEVQLEAADVLGRRRVGRPLHKRREPFATADMASLRARTKLARVHVLDHALAQRADRIRTHGQLLSWMRLTTPRSSRQGAPHAIDDLYPACRPRGRAPRAAGYRAAI